MTRHATEDVSAHEYLRPGHLAASRWVALPQLCQDADAVNSWQDISVRPEGTDQRGFTVALCTNEVLEGDFEEGIGPHPREKLPAGEAFAVSVESMAVYLARPFTAAAALAHTEVLLVEAGVPVASLEEVGREDFYGGLAERRAS